MNPISTNSSYVVYASLIVGALSHLGWIISQNDVITIIAGFVTLGATIYQHFHVSVSNANGVSAGLFKK